MTAYLFAGGKAKDYIAVLQQYPLITALAKFGITLPLSYHLLGGLRHLVRSQPRPSLLMVKNPRGRSYACKVQLPPAADDVVHHDCSTASCALSRSPLAGLGQCVRAEC